MSGLAKDIYLFLGYINKLIKAISILFMGLMTLTVVLQVIFRYVMVNPLIWTEELSRYLMIWMSFFAAGSVLRKWENIKVDFFIDKFKETPRKVIKLIIKMLVLAFCIYIFIVSINIYPKVSKNQLTSVLQISMLIPQFGIIVGMFFMVLQTIASIISSFITKEEK